MFLHENTILLSFRTERSEESRIHKVGVSEILRFALDDKFYCLIMASKSASMLVFFSKSQSVRLLN